MPSIHQQDGTQSSGDRVPLLPRTQNVLGSTTGPEVDRLETDTGQHLIPVVSAASWRAFYQRVSSCFVFGLLHLTSLHTQFPLSDLDRILVIFTVENVPSMGSRVLP